MRWDVRMAYISYIFMCLERKLIMFKQINQEKAIRASLVAQW